MNKYKSQNNININLVKVVAQLAMIQFLAVRCLPSQEKNKPADSSTQIDSAWNLHGENISNIKKPGTEKQLYNETHNPCILVTIEQPDFSRTDRRISEAKCLEYVWQMKDRRVAIQRQYECNEYHRKHLHARHKRALIRRVLNGRLAVSGEFLHMGAIGWRGKQNDWIFKCGGTIISHKFMVTAAHCSRASSRDPRLANPVPEIVRVGAKDLDTKPEFNNTLDMMGPDITKYPMDLKILQIIKHPNYSPPKEYFDIALMELDTDIRFVFNDNVRPACLWNSFNVDRLGAKASVSGWGITKTGVKETTNELRTGDLDLIDNNTCNELLQPLCNRHWCGLQEHQMCSGQLEGGADSCQGDSGGPLQVEIKLPGVVPKQPKMYYLLGVTSFGFGCGRPNQPGVYTRIASFTDWIESIVWPDELASGKYLIGRNDTLKK